MIGFFWPQQDKIEPTDPRQLAIDRISKKSEVRVGNLSYKENSIEDIIRLSNLINDPISSPGRTRRARGSI